MTIQCTICMSNLSVNETANAASCGHVFHEPCLVQWFNRSKTCPQCRARCDERHVRRLYFSAALNSSTVDVDSLQVELDDLKLEMRNLKTEVEAKKTEIKRLRESQGKCKLSLMGLEAQMKLAKDQLRNANAQIASQKSELDRMREVETELNKNLQESKNFDTIKKFVESDAVVCEVAELLRSHTDVKTLATLVSLLKNQLNSLKRSRDEVANHRNTCRDENAKLRRLNKVLHEKISTLESDNYKLQDDLSQMKRKNETNESKTEEHITASTSPASTQPSLIASRSVPSSSSTTPKTESPYLNIRQSNVGLTPLLNRKRKPEVDAIVGPYSNLSIFNNRQKLSKTVTSAQNSSHIYNGFGGSERKENFVGFPAGRGLPMSLLSSKSRVSKK